MHRSCAISPCPNDIYTFSGLLTKNIPHHLEFRVAPIGDLNRLAINGEVDIAKISAGTFSLVKDHYQPTKVGASFGQDNGPKLVQKKGARVSDSLAGETIISPGLSTTASFVIDHFFLHTRQIEAPLAKIPELISEGAFKLGIVLNESMQDMAKYDLVVIHDLAKLWFDRVGSLLPLGMIVAKKRMSSEEVTAFEKAVRSSLLWAKANHAAAVELACQWASEKSEEAVKAHIKEFTKYAGDSDQNQAALETFLAAMDHSFINKADLTMKPSSLYTSH